MTCNKSNLARLFCFLSIAVALPAARSYADPCACGPRRISYEGTELPDGARSAWTAQIDPAAQITTAGGQLSIDTSYDKASWAYYSRCVDIDFDRGVTVEARLKVARTIGDPGVGSAGIWIEDQIGGAVLIFQSDRIQLYQTSYSYAVDTSVFHVYRIVTKGYQLRVYIDGHLAIDTSDGYHPAFTLQDPGRIMFGDGSSGASALSTWDYVRYELGPVVYSGNQLPENASLSWQADVSSAASATSAAGILTLDSSRDVSASAYYSRCANIDHDRGITLTARFKLNSYIGTPDLGGAAISVSDKLGGAVLLLTTDHIQLYRTDYSTPIDTSTFHDYEIVTSGSSIQVYVDDTLMIDAPDGYSAMLASSGVGEIWFGDGSGGASASSSWDTLSYRNN